MTDPLEILKDEHRLIEQSLHALQGMCGRLKAGQAVPTEALVALLDFIQTFTYGRHYKKQEHYLLPALLQRGVPMKGGPLNGLLHDHEIERCLVVDLDRAVAAYAKGEAGASQLLTVTADHYVDLMTEHIQKEHDRLFPIAVEVLDPPALAALSLAFEEVDKEEGNVSRENYGKVVTALERAWAAPPAETGPRPPRKKRAHARA